MKIPFNDMSFVGNPLKTEIFKKWEKIIEESNYILGKEVDVFEKSFAQFSGMRHCIGVGNGTDALEISLRALEVGPGDEVIVPANSFIASALAVIRTGAKPVFIDCDEYYLLNVSDLERKLSKKTKVVMPVHLYGQMAQVEQIVDKIPQGVFLVEDSAQAQGATRNEKNCGSLGDLVATSFYPGKNLGAYGDAGAVLTNNADLAERVKRIRNYGSNVKYFHPEIGFNSRLDSLQAAVLNLKLEKLKEYNQLRNDIADMYNLILKDCEKISVPKTAEGNYHVWHLYVIRIKNRMKIIEFLKSKGIETGIHYPTPIHLQGAFRKSNQTEIFLNSENFANEILSLPIFPGMSNSQIEYVATNVIEAVHTHG
jgi:dTDP-4-amino-4,6-dideoxygalactose transaminase